MRGGLALVSYSAVTAALVAVSLGMAFEKLRTNEGAYHSEGNQLFLFVVTHLSKSSPKLAQAFPYLLGSNANLLILANMVFCILVVTALFVKACFFGALSVQELQRLMGRCVDYALLKIVFIAAIASNTTVEILVWAAWFATVGFIKLFSGLARDRFDSLVSTPSASYFEHGRNLLFVCLLMAADVSCAYHLNALMQGETVSKRALLMFDPVLILVDLAYTLLRSSMNLVERWHLSRVTQASAAAGSGISWQWMVPFLYYAEFTTTMTTHLLTLVHYCHVWFLHGLSFQVVDSIILLNIRSLLGVMYKRSKTFMAFHCATSNLKKAFPDASQEQLKKYGDVCAICKDSMKSAKVLPCGHMFHLPCLRSWLEQGEHGNYTCPLCRFSLTNTAMKETSQHFGTTLVQSWQNLGRQIEGRIVGFVDYLFLLLFPRQVAQAHGGHGGGHEAAAGPGGRVAWGAHGPVEQHHQQQHPSSQGGGGGGFSGWFSSGGAGRRRAVSRDAGAQNAGGGGGLDLELEGWTQIVSSILPHVPVSHIVRDLQRTRNPNITVNRLLGL